MLPLLLPWSIYPTDHPGWIRNLGLLVVKEESCLKPGKGNLLLKTEKILNSLGYLLIYCPRTKNGLSSKIPLDQVLILRKNFLKYVLPF